ARFQDLAAVVAAHAVHGRLPANPLLEDRPEPEAPRAADAAGPEDVRRAADPRIRGVSRLDDGDGDDDPAGAADVPDALAVGGDRAARVRAQRLRAARPADFFRHASSESRPGPSSTRKSDTNICANSERTSCSTAQKPVCGGAGGSGSGDVPRKSEIFVDSTATSISPMKTIPTSRVCKPARRSSPPTISIIATRSAVGPGNGNPSFVKRPIP